MNKYLFGVCLIHFGIKPSNIFFGVTCIYEVNIKLKFKRKTEKKKTYFKCSEA